eukprot:gene7716-5184_t
MTAATPGGGGGGDAAAGAARESFERLRSDCEAATLAAPPSAAALRAELGDAVTVSGVAQAWESLERQRRSIVGDARVTCRDCDAFGGRELGGEEFHLGARLLLPLSAADWVRGAQALRPSLRAFTASLQQPPSEQQGYCRFGVAPTGEGALSRAIENRLGAEAFVGAAPRADVAYRATAPVRGGKWAIIGFGYGLRAAPPNGAFRGAEQRDPKTLALRPGRALLLDARVEE